MVIVVKATAWSHWKTSVVASCGVVWGQEGAFPAWGQQEMSLAESSRNSPAKGFPWTTSFSCTADGESGQRKDWKGQCQGREKNIWVQHDRRAVDSLCHQVMWAGPGLCCGVMALKSHRRAAAAVCPTLFFPFFFQMTSVCAGHSGLKYLLAEPKGSACSHWAPMGIL